MLTTNQRRWTAFSVAMLLVGLAAAGCGDKDASEPPSPAKPSARASLLFDLPSWSAIPQTARNPLDDVEYSIADADLSRVAGDRLYVLARNSGLTVIDLSDPSHLAILGRYREVSGEPFELFLRGDVAVLVFNGWAEDLGQDGWAQSSKVLTLDVADASAMRPLAGIEIPGDVTAAYITTNMLYVASREDGRCYGCAPNRLQTSIRSLDLRERTRIREIDRTESTDSTEQTSDQRLFVLSGEHMYTAVPVDSGDPESGSAIELVDLSDPDGHFRARGVAFTPARISQREHLSEHAGVLRVISQPPADPHRALRTTVQTFELDPSRGLGLVPLARIELDLPSTSGMRSAQFDGSRLYVEPASHDGSVHLVDLSDPTKPTKVGVLEFPGALQRFEARGDRLFAQYLGERATTLGLFDVQDLRAPKLLSSVDFDGYGDEPQALRKLFTILDDPSLSLVPSASVQLPGEPDSCGSEGSAGGLQLIEHSRDGLSRAGSVWFDAYARQVFAHRDHVLIVGDTDVTAFDVRNRAAPAVASTLAIARPLLRAVQLEGERVVRTNAQPAHDVDDTLEIVSASAAESFHEPVTALTRRALSDCRMGNVYDLHADGSNLFVEGSFWDAESFSWGSMFVAVDARESSGPRAIARGTFGHEDWQTYTGNARIGPPLTNAWGSGFAAKLEWIGEEGDYRSRARVVDLRGSEQLPSVTVELPAAPELHAGLVQDGRMLVTSRFASTASSGRSKVYAERIDVSDPAAPELLPAIQVPGVVLHYDHAHARALTLSVQREQVDAVSEDECKARFASYELSDEGICLGFVQALNLVRFEGDSAELEDTLELSDDEWVTASSAGDGVVFVAVGSGGYFTRIGSPPPACEPPCEREPVDVLGLRGFDSDELQVDRFAKTLAAAGGAGGWGPAQLQAAGNRALLVRDSYAAVLDASEPGAPAVTKIEGLRGYVRSIDIREDRALLTLDDVGSQWIEL